MKSNDELAAELASLGETDTDNSQRFVSRFGTKVIITYVNTTARIALLD